MRYIFSDIVLNFVYVCLFTTLLQNNFKAYSFNETLLYTLWIVRYCICLCITGYVYLKQSAKLRVMWVALNWELSCNCNLITGSEIIRGRSINIYILSKIRWKNSISVSHLKSFSQRPISLDEVVINVRLFVHATRRDARNTRNFNMDVSLLRKFALHY